MTRTVIWLAVPALLAAPAMAQDGQLDTSNVTYREVTVIEIDNDLELTGTFQTPGIGLIHGFERTDFNPLLQMKTDFDREMQATVHEVK